MSSEMGAVLAEQLEKWNMNDRLSEPVVFTGTITQPVHTLQDRLDALKAYCRSCLDAGDWHGVRDAAVDIEVVQARIDVIVDSTV